MDWKIIQNQRVYDGHFKVDKVVLQHELFGGGLRLEINAEFQWMFPPKNTEERIFREQSNARIAYLASKLEAATKLILLEMATNSFDE